VAHALLYFCEQMTPRPGVPGARFVRAGVFLRCRGDHVLETIAVILVILWLLGLVSGYTMGNFIYILLVIAIVLILVRLISGRTV
jgi:uncharacterized membrane protein YjdF